MKKTAGRSMLRKISRAMVLVAFCTILTMSIIFIAVIYDIRKNMIESSGQMGDTTRGLSSESMNQLATEHILKLAEAKANLADNIFKDFRNNIQIVVDAAQMAYDGADSDPGRDIPLPNKENEGTLSVQLLFSEKTDASDEHIIKETQLLGKLQDILLAVNENNENMISNYIATETGIMIQVDYISGEKFDEDGNIMTYEALTRPWYIGAKETGKHFFTSVSKDAHTEKIGIMCGVPIFHDSKLMGVAGAGMYLDNVEALVRDIELGESGDACLINENGEVLFSTRKDGALVAEVEGADLQASSNNTLAEVVNKAVSGESGVTLIELDGESYYIAYAPMETVGWSFLVILSENEVESPTKRLTENIGHLNEEVVGNIDNKIRSIGLTMLLVMGFACLIVMVVATRLSHVIVKPINKLTERVRSIEGDSLDFVWEDDTGDETQLLALSFQSLTERIKEYISEVQAITAEKERIGAELSVATQIQADMLPCIFPAFPERTEFDIYASMTPAKEVGGDFYDFFLLDDDHLAMVIADVSGKGVPAALFMVISKTLIKNQAQIYSSPKEILEKVNNLLCANNREGMFVTVWLGIMEISTGKVMAANAGHEYPAVRKADGMFELLKDKHGMVAGVMQDMKYTEYEMEIEEGGCLFVYTDGVPEATNAQNQLFGTDRMVAALNREPSAPPEQLLINVKGAVDEFVGEAPQFDDLTMLAMERKLL